jgi:hypothetical protein
MTQMKILCILAIILISCLTWRVYAQKTPDKFNSKRISKTAEIVLNAPVSQIYPLFGAFEERKVDYNWKPLLVFPEKEIIEEGTTFKTIAHKHAHGNNDEKEYLWVVTKYEPDNYLIQYLVSTPNRFWTVTVKCEAISNQQTKAKVTYTYTGLNEQGNKMNELALATMYKQNLQDWQEGINYYLKTGKAINEPK